MPKPAYSGWYYGKKAGFITWLTDHSLTLATLGVDKSMPAGLMLNESYSYMVAGKRIYIADDQADYRLVLQQLFRHHLPAYCVELFNSGYTLLQELVAARPAPDLIILDQHMPQLSGYQTLRSLKAHRIHERIPVVMMSHAASEVEIRACYEAGADAFIRKEIDLQAMAQKLEEICQ